MRTSRYCVIAILTALGLASGSPLRAANVSLTASDAINTTSFNAAGHWSDSAAPSAANDYFTAGFGLRTPNNSTANLTFAGNSLTINGGSMLYKGSGSRTITVNNLTLDNNGQVANGNGNTTMTLAGNGMTVNTTGNLFTTTDSSDRYISVTAPIFGTGTITTGGNGYIVLNNIASTFSGKWVLSSRQNRLSGDGVLGAVPANLVPDSVTLNGGALMNNSTALTLSANRGITLGANGGLIEAGWSLPITINGPITGAGGLTIQNDATPGVITLNGTNTYTGLTRVANSTANWAILLVNGSLGPASTVAVTARGWLGGSGVINGPVWATNNATVSAGDILRPGTLTLNNSLSLSNALLSFDLSSDTSSTNGANDLIQVNGDLDLAGSITVNLYALGGSTLSGTYRLINYTGNVIGGATNLVAAPSRYTVTFDTSTPGQVNVTVSGAPTDIVWTGASDYNWNISGSTNWLAGADPTVFLQGDRVLFDDSGRYASNINMVGDVSLASTLLPGRVTVNTTNNVTLTSTGTGGRLGGSMGLYKSGAGTLTLTGGNGNMPNAYDGITVISDGTLKPGFARALGSALSSVYATNTGTLDVNGQNLGLLPVTVGGAGAGGNGAIVNSGAAQNNALGTVTLVGDTTFGGAGRWDIRNAPASLSTGGNAYNLVKTGANQVSLVGVAIDPALGDVDVQQGILSFESTSTGLGNPTNRLTIESNAAFQFWGATNLLDKVITFNGGAAANLINGSGSNNIVGPITLGADSLWNIGGTTLSIFSGIDGSGGLIKAGNSPLRLNGTNTFTGNTTINAGTVVLGPQSGLSASPVLTVATNAALDVSAISGFALASGQTLTGSGLIAGDVVAGASTAVIPGPGIGTLSFSNSLTMNSSSNVFELGTPAWQVGSGVNDLISVGGGLNLSGTTTIKIVPVATLDNTYPYTLFTYATGLTGGTNNLRVITDSRYNFALLDPTATAPNIQVQISGSGTAASLIWQGGQAADPTAWDLKTTSNWLNGAASDLFYSGDNVAFNDSGTTNRVTLADTVKPAGIMLSNNAVSYTLAGPGALAGGSLASEGAGTFTVANDNANTFVGAVTVDNGTLVFSNSGPNTIGGGLVVNSGTAMIANPSANSFGSGASINGGTLVFQQPVNVNLSSTLTDNGSGAGTVVKQGANLLTLSGNNSAYNGAILVKAGALIAANTNALGSASGMATVAAGAALDVNGQNLGAKPVTVIGAGLNGYGTIVNSGAAQINALGSVTLAGDATFGGTNRWDIRNVPATLSTGSNPYNLTKVGPNQFSLVGATVDPMLGNIDVQQGIFSIETSTPANGVGDPTKTITIHPNASLQFYNLTAALDKFIVLDGGGANANVINYSGANTVVGAVTLNDNCSFNVGGTSLTLNGPVSGAGTLTKIGGNTLILGNTTNRYTGGTVISAGTLQVGTSGADGSIPDLGITDNGALTFNSQNDFTLTNEIAGSGVLNKLNDNTLTLTASNSFRGNVNTGSGTPTTGGKIRILNSHALGGPDATKTVNLIRAELQLVGPLDLGTNLSYVTSANSDVTGVGGGYVAFRNVSGTNVVEGNIILAGGAGSSEAAADADQLTLSGTIAPNTTARGFYLSGAAVGIVNGSINDGTGANTLSALEKRGPGTWILNTTNGYSGRTTIKGGTLQLGPQGSIANSSLIDVQAGATLDAAATTQLVLNTNQTLEGNGTVLGAVNAAAGATVAAGEAVGTLTFSNALTFAAGSTNVAEIDKVNTTNDLVTASSLTYGGTLAVSLLNGSTLAAGDSFKLFNAATYSGAFTQIVPASPGPGLLWKTDRLAIDGTLQVIAPPQLGGGKVLPDGNFRLTISGPVGGHYSVLASTNAGLPVVSWDVLSSGTIATTPFFYDDLTATNYPQRFYLISTP